MNRYGDLLDSVSDYALHEAISDVVESFVRAAKQSAYASGFQAGIALVVEAMSGHQCANAAI